MIFISHRGNTTGPDKKSENSPEYINHALGLGYNVEIDVWLIDQQFYLGHDDAQYPVDLEFLKNKRLWCHAKNYEALLYMKKEGIHCFWHEQDKVTLTTEGFIWTYPGNQPLKDSIAVMPERNDEEIKSCLGVCSDYIQRYKKETK